MDSLRLSSSFLLLPTITREHIFLLPSPPLSLSTLFSAPFLKKKALSHLVMPYRLHPLAVFFFFSCSFLSARDLLSCLSFIESIFDILHIFLNSIRYFPSPFLRVRSGKLLRQFLGHLPSNESFLIFGKRF